MVQFLLHHFSGDRGVFGGGDPATSYTSVIDYITISSTGDAQTFGNLTANRSGASGTSNGTNERGVFGGGYEPWVSVDTIEYVTINSPSAAENFGDLTLARSALGATSNANGG